MKAVSVREEEEPQFIKVGSSASAIARPRDSPRDMRGQVELHTGQADALCEHCVWPYEASSDTKVGDTCQETGEMETGEEMVDGQERGTHVS